MDRVGMNSRFFLLAITLVSTFGVAYAQPLQEVNTDVLEFDGSFATVNISWNDNGAFYYEIGCVSCIPNLSGATTENSFVLNNVTPFADGNALLYVLAYNDSEIISAKQIMMELP